MESSSFVIQPELPENPAVHIGRSRPLDQHFFIFLQLSEKWSNNKLMSPLGLAAPLGNPESTPGSAGERCKQLKQNPVKEPLVDIYWEDAVKST